MQIKSQKIEKDKLHIGVLAYADDTTWITSTQENMQKTINISNEFYELNDIEINPSKTELVVFSPGKKRNIDEHFIWAGTPRTKILAKSYKESTRFLGVWISVRNQQKSDIDKAKKEVNKITGLLKHKKISLSQIVYINNAVLIPALEYRLMISCLSKAQCDKIHQPMLHLAKWKMSIPSTAANAIPKHPEIVNFKSLWNRHIEHHFTELLVRLNTNGPLEKSIVIRLKQGQLKAGSISCIMTNQQLLERKTLKIRNLGIHILQQAKFFGFTIKENNFTRSWKINMMQVMNDQEISKILEKGQLIYEKTNASKAGIWLSS